MPSVRQPWECAVMRPEGVLFCISRPGDILFVPEGWWHATWNLDDFVIGIGWEGGQSSEWHAGLHAIADGDLSRLMLWWQSEISLQTITWDMLYVAARAGHTIVLQWLLKQHGLVGSEDLPAAIAAGAALGGHLEALQLVQASTPTPNSHNT